MMSDALDKIDSEDFVASVAGANEIGAACGARPLVQTVDDVDGLMSRPFRIGR